MLDFSIYTINGDHKFSINEENDFTTIVYSNLISIFSEIDYENHIIHFCCQQKMDDNIREKINKWVLTYESANIQIRKVKKYFDDIPNEEYFFVFPTLNFSPVDIIAIFENLRALNEGKNQEEIDKQIANEKRSMMNYYLISSKLIRFRFVILEKNTYTVNKQKKKDVVDTAKKQWQMGLVLKILHMQFLKH